MQRRRQQGELLSHHRQGFDVFADAGHAGPTTPQAEGHVGTERGRQGQVIDTGPPQHSGGVRRPATKAGAGRDALVEADVGGAAYGGQGLGDQVVWAGTHAGGCGPVDLQAVAVGELQLVGQVDGDHLGVNEVEAVGADASDPQRQRQLR